MARIMKPWTSCTLNTSSNRLDTHNVHINQQTKYYAHNFNVMKDDIDNFSLSHH